MKKQMDYKVENGKLLRISIDIEKGIIRDIKINGDFFIYPEEAIFDIESALRNVKLNDVKYVLDSFIKSKDIKIIGFSSEDVVSAINKKNEKIKNFL